MSTRVRLSAAVAVLLAVMLGAVPASATEGSVPPEVVVFASDPDGLVLSLDDFFGLAADGTGIDFDDTTTIGRIDRVFSFTPDWLAGEPSETPVLIANQWVAPVTIADEPVGVAVIWINPGTVRPQLADFLPSPDLAAALVDLPAESSLVFDDERASWLLLEQSTLTPLLGGGSPTTLTAYQRGLSAADAAPPVESANLGSVLSVGIIVAVALVVVLVLLIPLARRRRAARPAAEDGDLG